MSFPALLAIALPVALFALLALVIPLVRRQRERVIATWRSLAGELGSRFEESSGSLFRRRPFQFGARVEAIERTLGRRDDSASGLDADAEVRLDSFVVGNGQHATTYTRATVAVPTDHVLHLRREHAFSGLGKLLGLQDLRVADAEYDAAFLIKADDETWLRERLGSELRRLHLKHPQVVLRLENGELTAVQRGFLADRDGLLALLQLAVLAGRTFSR